MAVIDNTDNPGTGGDNPAAGGDNPVTTEPTEQEIDVCEGLLQSILAELVKINQKLGGV